MRSLHKLSAMQKRIRYQLLIGLLCFCTFAFVSKKTQRIPASLFRVEIKKAKSGSTYTFFHQEKSKARFVVTRPSAKDTSLLLCIPAAFTMQLNNTIDGFYMVEGKPFNTKAVNHRLGGAAHFVNGKISFFDTHRGAIFTPAAMDSLKKTGGSLFQQIMIISDGKAARFKDTALFQRRAIVHFANGKTAVAENNKPIRLADFSNDLVELGVTEAIYTDMGSWDEGWYRDPETGKLKIIGQIRTQTARQSNWVVFAKK